MRWKVVKAASLFMLCIFLLSACQLLSKDVAPKHAYASTFSEKQFCQFILNEIKNQDHMMEYCFKYPVSAFIHMDWYWIDRKRIHMYLSQNRLDSGVSGVDINSGHSEELVLDLNKPIVYLTFDDGPGKYTDKVLDILKEENVKATFFVLGQQVEKNPLFSKRIVDEGHTIGNHTYNHDYKEIYNSFDQFANQVIKTNKIVYELTGYKIDILRAPGGSINNFDEGYFQALDRAGFIVFDWNIDTRDSLVRGITSEEVMQNIRDSPLLNPAIVLLHDTNNHEQSMLALPSIIFYYREQGYQFAPITSSTTPVTFNLGKKLNWNRAAVTESEMQNFATSVIEIYQ